jgi:SAM-dependent methyltransferase
VEPKPAFWDRQYAERFGHEAVVANYRFRPTYPAELFDLLADSARGGAVLDAGTGPGDIARPLAALVRRVDAVDLAPAMLAEGRRREGGDRPNLRWVAGPIEEVELDSPYDLIVAGDSVHWFDWPVVMPRFRRLLAPGGLLAIVTRDWFAANDAITGPLREIYARFSTNRAFVPADPADELEKRGLFRPVRRATTDNSPWVATIDELVSCHHSQNGFAPHTMADDARVEFDRELADAFASFVAARVVEMEGERFRLNVRAQIVWGAIPP